MSKFTDPKLISQEDMDAVQGSIEALRALSIYSKPAAVRIQEAEMHARAQDYVELAEQEYIRGWTDCEQGLRHKEHPISRLHNGTYQRLSQAYNAGYGDCYEYEQRQNIEPVIGSYEEMSKGDK